MAELGFLESPEKNTFLRIVLCQHLNAGCPPCKKPSVAINPDSDYLKFSNAALLHFISYTSPLSFFFKLNFEQLALFINLKSRLRARQT